MGYYSAIRVDAVITAPLGTEEGKLFEDVSVYLKGLEDHIGHWIYVEENDSEELAVLPHGESGKAYEWENELTELTRWLDARNYVLNGTFYREGEEQGDLERYTVTDNILVETAVAQLMFPDGEVYNR